MDLAGAVAFSVAAGVVVGGGAGILLGAGMPRRGRTGPTTGPETTSSSSQPAPAAGETVPPAPDAPAVDTTALDADPPAPADGLDTGTDEQHPTGRLAEASIAALRVGVVVLDGSGRVVLANPMARRLGLVRRDRGVLTAHSVLRTLGGRINRPGQQRDVDLGLNRRDLPRDVADRPRTGAKSDNGPDWFGVRVRLVGLADGYVAMEAEDVTEAHRVAQVRRDFVANVSHELKTPVGALQLLGEALLDALDDPTAARRFAVRIAHESSRLGRLVTELLELSRLQGADPLPELKPVSADQLVAEVLDRTRTTAQSKEITITTGGRCGLTVYGNETQLATAMANLVENALAYSPEGTTVSVGVRREDDAVLLSVTDQGIGIEPSDLDRIFERFYRADKARSRATGGTGLGLAIVKHIATNHGGRVDVASSVGNGSVFTLRLPADPPDDIAVEHNPGEIAEDIGAVDVHHGSPDRGHRRGDDAPQGPA